MIKKKWIILVILLISLLPITLKAEIIQGDTLRIDGKLICNVYGTHAERGYAYGYLLGKGMMEIVEQYIIGDILSNSSFIYNALRTEFINDFILDAEYVSETKAIIEGAKYANHDLYVDALQRELDYIDIFIANSIPDLLNYLFYNYNIKAGLYCSSLSSFSLATQNDSELKGDPQIVRNLDWDSHPSLFKNQVILVSFPSETDEQNWISFGFTGLISALSGINESGVATFQNVGSHMGPKTGSSFFPINLSQRKGLEKKDYNGDGISDIQDVRSSISDTDHSCTYIIHSLGKSLVNDSYSEIVEFKNGVGSKVRTIPDNDPVIGNNLLATNHFRKLYAAQYCSRYKAVSDSLIADNEVTIDRAWDIMKNGAGVNTTKHTIQFMPTLNKLRYSISTASTPAHLCEPTEFSLDSLFNYNVDIKEDLMVKKLKISSFPNPFNPSCKVSFVLSNNINKTLKLFNSNGQEVPGFIFQKLKKGLNNITINGQNLVSGMYYLKLIDSNNQVLATKKLTLLK